MAEGAHAQSAFVKRILGGWTRRRGSEEEEEDRGIKRKKIDEAAGEVLLR